VGLNDLLLSFFVHYSKKGQEAVSDFDTALGGILGGLLLDFWEADLSL
jgi:hypothetical protein